MRRPPLILAVFFFACATDAEVLRGYAEVNGTQLYYEQAGEGSDLVLLQGGQLDCRMWDPQFEAFASSHRVLRYDVRGFGRSGETGDAFQHHEDLFALLQELDIEQADFVGLSLGGRIALDLALTHPESVRSIVLSGPGISGFDWSGDDTWIDIEVAVLRDDARAAAEAWLEHPYMAPSMEHRELRKRLHELALDNRRVWVRERTEEELSPPAIGRLAEIEAPVRLLVGTRDVPDIQRICDRLQEELPDVERVDIQGGGHMLNLEDPERFNALVFEFLRSSGSPLLPGARGDRP